MKTSCLSAVRLSVGVSVCRSVRLSLEAILFPHIILLLYGIV